MKELNSHIKAEIQITEAKEYAKKKAYLGSLRRHPGQTVFQMNIRTGIILPAEFSETTAHLRTGQIIKKILIKEDTVYCVAINESNASKKFMKMFRVSK